MPRGGQGPTVGDTAPGPASVSPSSHILDRPILSLPQPQPTGPGARSVCHLRHSCPPQKPEAPGAGSLAQTALAASSWSPPPLLPHRDGGEGGGLGGRGVQGGVTGMGADGGGAWEAGGGVGITGMEVGGWPGKQGVQGGVTRMGAGEWGDGGAAWEAGGGCGGASLGWGRQPGKWGRAGGVTGMGAGGPHQDSLLDVFHPVVVLLQHRLGPGQVQILIAMLAPGDGRQPVQVVPSDAATGQTGAGERGKSTSPAPAEPTARTTPSTSAKRAADRPGRPSWQRPHCGPRHSSQDKRLARFPSQTWRAQGLVRSLYRGGGSGKRETTSPRASGKWARPVAGQRGHERPPGWEPCAHRTRPSPQEDARTSRPSEKCQRGATSKHRFGPTPRGSNSRPHLPAQRPRSLT